MNDNTESPNSADGQEQSNLIKSNVKSLSAWRRIFFVLVVVGLYWVCAMVVGAVVILQCFWLLFSSQSNEKLKGFGQKLATYIYGVIRYLTFDTEERPFPFDADWPAGPPAE